MGRKASFVEGIKAIDDDYVYRQEDFVFSDIVKKAGGKEGFISSAFHYHQTMKKPSPTGRQVKNVKIEMTMNKEEEVRSWDMQVKGIVKYFDPEIPWLIDDAIAGSFKLIRLEAYSPNEPYAWIKEQNPKWLPVIKRGVFRFQLQFMIRNFLSEFGNLLKLK